MKTLAFSITFLALTIFSSPVQAQAEEKVYSYKKGQVVDFLFLSRKAGTEEKLKEYFGTVFPLVQEAGYRPLPSFRIAQSPTQGNYHPEVLAIASWTDLASRKAAMKRIDEQVPNFHQKRMDIWSSFAMTFYEMKQDVSFAADPTKIYVLTAYWQEDAGFDQFKQDWLRKTEQAGGEIKLQLEDGTSPFGYRYQPDFMAISQWQNRSAFEAFYQTNLAMDHDSIEHVNQFILDLPPSKGP